MLQPTATQSKTMQNNETYCCAISPLCCNSMTFARAILDLVRTFHSSKAALRAISVCCSVLQCVAVLLIPALLQCVAMVHTAVLLQFVAVLLTAVLYSPCNTHCNTHCNTYCNTRCNTHLSVMPTAALSAFSTPSVLLNFWRQPLCV